MDWLALPAAALAVVGLAAAASFAGTYVVLRQARRRAILAHPNERSSHTVPTPHGAGIAVVGVILVAWLVIALNGPGASPDTLMIVACCLPLAAVSRLDDLHGLAPLWRLLAHGTVVAAALALTAPAGPYFQGLLPPWLDRAVAGLLWVWFINLFNFMDGIDGITGAETVAVGGGVAVVALVPGVGGSGEAGADIALRATIAAAAAIGFLWWNRPPARIFLGDVGSVPLGFLVGWLLLELAARGQWAPALILPAYYLADATATLVRRGLRGETVWRAHRQHYYQRAVGRGRGHGSVVGTVTVTNVVLVGLALGAVLGWPGTALGGACIVVVVLLRHLGGGLADGETST